MQLQTIMAELKKKGTAQNRKVYRRHGASEPLFGVSFAHLKTLQKKIGKDHPLAEKLWLTKNSDAQTLALLIADPEAISARQADQWVAEVDYYLLADYMAKLIARSKLAKAKLKKWTSRKKEYTRQCGYSILCSMLVDDPKQMSEELCREYLHQIEKEIAHSANRARHAMNMGLIAIGIYKPHLRPATLAAARRIGKVEVDHGETSCKTPDAESYIAKAVSRKSTPKKSATKKKKKTASNFKKR